MDGTIKTNDGEALAFSNIRAYTGDSDSLIHGTTTDLEGHFELCLPTYGAYRIVASFIGMIDVEKEVSYTAENDPHILEFRLVNNPEAHVLACPIITYEETFADGSIQFARKEFNTMPGAYEDPARLMMKYPGFTNGNDQANGIIYNGLGAHLSRWAIDGLEIVNPNHLSNAGTLSDLSSSSAGGVSALSGNIMRAFSYHANPAKLSFTNGISGYADVNPSNTLENYVSLGLLGLESGWQIGSRSNGPNLIANYRYSFVGLLAGMGVDFGGEKIGFQDLFLATNFFPDYAKHQLKIQYLFASDFNVHDAVAEESDIEIFKDIQDIDFEGRIQYAGLNYTLRNWDHHNDLQLKLNYSYKIDTRQSLIAEPFYFEYPGFSQFASLVERLLHASLKSNHAIGKSMVHYGMSYRYGNQKQTLENNILLSKTFAESFHTAQIFVYLDYEKYQDFHAQLGSNILFDIFTDEFLLEPYFKLSKHLNDRVVLSLASKFNSQAPSLNHIAMRKEDGLLKRMKSINSDIQLNHDSGLGLKLFYSHLYDMGRSEENYYHALNEYSYAENISLSFDGLARTVGITGYYDQSFGSKESILIGVNGSLFQSSFNSNGKWLAGKYDHNYAGNLNVSKSFGEASSNRWTGNISASYHLRGGIYTNQIGESASEEFYMTVVSYDQPYEVKLKPYQRVDFRIMLQKRSKLKFIDRRIISLDIQNVLNVKNDGYVYFDNHLGTLHNQLQLGMIPVLSYKIIFE